MSYWGRLLVGQKCPIGTDINIIKIYYIVGRY